MTPLNYTTSIPAERTIGEISKLLAKRGAASISTGYDEGGRADGLSFRLRTPHGPRDFMLRVNVQGVLALLANDPKVRSRGPSFRSVDHAERVAWRVVKDWIEAQLGLIDADMASLDQVMLPYLVTRPDGTTLYAAYREREQTALEA